MKKTTKHTLVYVAGVLLILVIVISGCSPNKKNDDVTSAVSDTAEPDVGMKEQDIEEIGREDYNGW